MADDSKASDDPKQPSALAQSALTAVVIGAVALGVWFGSAPKVASSADAVRNVQGLTMSLSDVPTKGSSAAKVVVVEFADFECPFCARFATGPQQELIAKYVNTGLVTWAFRHLPLAQVHPEALRAAEVAECARRQGRFWEAHDTLYQNQQALARGQAVALVQGVVSDSSALSACAAREQARDRVVADLKEASRLGLRSTPIFAVGTRQPDGLVKIAGLLSGARSAADFSRALDAVLASTK